MVVGKAQLVVVKEPAVVEKALLEVRKALLVGGKHYWLGESTIGCVKSTIGCGKSTIGWGKAQFVNPGQIVIFGSVPAHAVFGPSLRQFKNIQEHIAGIASWSVPNILYSCEAIHPSLNKYCLIFTGTV